MDGEDIAAVLDREVMSISDLTDSLRSLTHNVAGMKKSIEMIKWYIGGSVAVGLVVVGLLR